MTSKKRVGVLLQHDRKTPRQASLDRAIEGMRILSDTLRLATQRLTEEGVAIPERLPFPERFAMRKCCRQILAASGLDVGASRRDTRRWVDASYKALYRLLTVIEMVSVSRLKTCRGESSGTKIGFPSPLVFLDRAKICEWGEYVDWAQDMSRSIVGSVVAQVDVLRNKLGQ